MKKTVTKIICVLLIAAMFITPITSFAASESSYKANFKISAAKTTGIAKNDTVKITVSLKTNYGIYAMGLPVIYNAEKFSMQNTSDTDVSSFLTFQGAMKSAYITTGNWKSPDAMYSRCSNTSYWTKAATKSKYKIAYATWAADSTKSPTPVTLSTEENIVSFTLKAKKDIAVLTTDDIFVSMDFLKTASCAGGLLYVGRCSGAKVSQGQYVAYGQTINVSYNYKNPDPEPENISISINYKKSVDLMDKLSGYKKSTTTFKSSDTSIVSMDGSVAKGVGKGTATVTVKDSSTNKVANVKIEVKYSALQWIIVILLFGWIWY